MKSILKRMDDLSGLGAGWPEDAPAPSRDALKTAFVLAVRLCACGYDPFIGPEYEGGIGLTIRRPACIAYVTCFNNGAVVSTLDDGKGDARTEKYDNDWPSLRWVAAAVHEFIQGRGHDCPTCGAGPGQHCVSATGLRARKAHVDREQDS